MPWTELIAEQSSCFPAKMAEGEDGKRILTYQQAIKEAICQALEIDKNVIILGEGVDTAGYIYDTTAGTGAQFGKDRVIETPIAEAAIAGIALGAAITGMRPVIMHMRNDFLLMSMDQIINHISHWQNIFGGDVPVVIRAIIARGWGSGAQHSQSFQRLFAGFEGLDVVMPYTPYDVKGMFLSAISGKKPVLFLEHRWLYGDKGYVPQEPYFSDLHSAAIRKQGSDVTVVGMSLANRDISDATASLSGSGIDIEWIDLRCIYPPDMDCISTSVKKTGRLVIVENGTVHNGIGAEVIARICENCFDSLKKPVKRIGWKTATVPAGPRLEEKVYPGADEIINEIRGMMGKYEFK
ncbi:MAG: alpha-ketoacid dehydrogenase subunit beta [Ruminiclostridium sp.]|nr:alpha-ketoacid dehydrogenase subunit beta [Ruminiclostridium sp.]